MHAHTGVSVVILAGLLWALQRLRVWQLSRQYVRALEARVAERARIARDLHDVLGGFTGLLLRLEAVSILFQTRPAEAKQTLDSTIAQTAAAIKEGWEAVHDLRGSVAEPDNLAAAIGRLAAELSAPGAQPQAHVELQGTDRSLHPIVAAEVYRIAREALRNAFQHSHGTEIRVELHYHERQFGLRIHDDGRGVDPQVLASGGRDGHFGLQGMCERAELAGGNLTLRSAQGAGTELQLTIPAARAYASTRQGLFPQNDAQGPYPLGAMNQHALDVAGSGGTRVKDGIPGGRECGVLVRVLHAFDNR